MFLSLLETEPHLALLLLLSHGGPSVVGLQEIIFGSK